MKCFGFFIEKNRHISLNPPYLIGSKHLIKADLSYLTEPFVIPEIIFFWNTKYTNKITTIPTT